MTQIIWGDDEIFLTLSIIATVGLLSVGTAAVEDLGVESHLPEHYNWLKQKSRIWYMLTI